MQGPDLHQFVLLGAGKPPGGSCRALTSTQREDRAKGLGGITVSPHLIPTPTLLPELAVTCGSILRIKR